MQPFIRWAGSKRKALKTLRAFWSGGYSRYIEPFAGGACLFFDIEPASAILGDINPELINALKAVRNRPRSVSEKLAKLRIGETHYYRMRRKDPHHLSELDRAARFLYLNRFCFNGLYRTNTEGHFNVPYGPPKSGESHTRLAKEILLNASRVLRRATLLNCDFESTLSMVRRGDFVYMDPPYVVGKRRVFTEYARGTFRSSDLVRLRACLESLCRQNVDFVVTYADSCEARTLFSEFNVRRIWTRRHIAGFASARRGSYELLATNINL